MTKTLKQAALLPCFAAVLLVLPDAIGAAVLMPQQQLLTELVQDIAALRSGEYGFWTCHGLDAQHGGFHGTVSRDGTPIKPDAKGLVQQTRHIWLVTPCALVCACHLKWKAH
jgi:hypothetical protein